MSKASLLISRTTDRSLSLLRVAVAILLGIHGWARVLMGGVAPFGEYLQATGFPMAS